MELARQLNAILQLLETTFSLFPVLSAVFKTSLMVESGDVDFYGALTYPYAYSKSFAVKAV
jgi:hypothetical protein